jgi:hypothetical protein
MRKINSMLAAAAIVGTASMVAFTNEAQAHPGDVHHWFEHQRALSDGGPMIINDSAPVKQAEVSDERARPARQELSRAQGATDCFSEELKRGEGYIPPGDCDGPTRRTRPETVGGLK